MLFAFLLQNLVSVGEYGRRRDFEYLDDVSSRMAFKPWSRIYPVRLRLWRAQRYAPTSDWEFVSPDLPKPKSEAPLLQGYEMAAIIFEQTGIIPGALREIRWTTLDIRSRAVYRAPTIKFLQQCETMIERRSYILDSQEVLWTYAYRRLHDIIFLAKCGELVYLWFFYFVGPNC